MWLIDDRPRIRYERWATRDTRLEPHEWHTESFSCIRFRVNWGKGRWLRRSERLSRFIAWGRACAKALQTTFHCRWKSLTPLKCNTYFSVVTLTVSQYEDQSLRTSTCTSNVLFVQMSAMTLFQDQTKDRYNRICQNMTFQDKCILPYGGVLEINRLWYHLFISLH